MEQGSGPNFGYQSSDFYQDILGRPLSDAEMATAYLRLTVENLTAYLDRISRYPDVEIVREQEEILGGLQVVFRCADGRILIVRQEEVEKFQGVE